MGDYTIYSENSMFHLSSVDQTEDFKKAMGWIYENYLPSKDCVRHNCLGSIF